MYSLEVDDDRTLLSLTLSGAVRQSDLTELRDTAVTTGRMLGPEFALVSDFSDCEQFPRVATDCVRTIVSHFVSFGLSREYRVVGDATSSAAIRVLRSAADAFDYPVKEFPTREAAERAARRHVNGPSN